MRGGDIAQHLPIALVGGHSAAMNHALLSLLRAFAGICTFQRAPQDIPPSSALLALTTVGYLALSMMVYGLLSPIAHPLVKAVVEIAVFFAVTCTLLFVMSYGRRLLQTLTALMGCGTLIAGVGLLAMVLARVLPRELSLAILSIIALLNLLIMAHILRHALSTWFPVGLLFAFGYERLVNKLFVIADALLGAVPI